MRVRGFHPFEPINPTLSTELPMQDWIDSDGVFDSTSNSFFRDSLPGGPINEDPAQPLQQSQPTTSGAGGDVSSGVYTLELNGDVIAEILAATRSSTSWRACQMEGTSRTGTAEENIQKFVSTIGQRLAFKVISFSYFILYPL
jgi:hypothetical protein